MQVALPDEIVVPRQYRRIRERLQKEMVFTDHAGVCRSWVREVPVYITETPVLATLCALCSDRRVLSYQWHTSSMAAIPKVCNHRWQAYAEHAESKMHRRAIQKLNVVGPPGALAAAKKGSAGQGGRSGEGAERMGG